MNKKRSSIIILALLCLTLLTSVGILPVSASETVLNANYAKYKAVRDELDSEMEAYLALDTTDEKSISHKTNSIIGEYAKQAVDLNSSPESQTEDLTERFDLLLAKGKLAGKIAWIANLHTKANPSETMLTKLSELRAKVDAKTSPYDLAENSEFANTVCIEMSRTVFCELIQNETRENDSEKAIAILRNGIAKIELCSYADIDGAEFLSIYNEVMRVVSLQRCRDGAEKELNKVYVIIKGSSDGFLENSFVKAFFATVDGNLHVDESLSVKDINAALITAANGILDEEIASGDKYVFAYRESLKSSFERSAVQATATGVFAPISENLSNYAKDLYKAQTKDKISALISAEETNTDLLGLVSEYTDNGGILDACDSAEAMDKEYTRASHRVAWYREYAACKQSIQDILFVPAKDISDKLTSYARDNIYLVIDAEIKSADMLNTNAEEIILASLKKGRLSLEDLLCDAKAEKFCIDNKAILEDTSIDENDRSLLEKAMSEYDSILKSDELTAEKLKPQKNVLNDKYKELIKFFVSSTATGDDASFIINAINAISSDLAPYELKEKADEYLLRAEALGVLQKKYASVTDDPSYQSYDSDSKSSLSADYRIAANAILYSVASDSSLQKKLDKINADAELSIERHAAIAKIRLAAKDSSLSDVQKTLEDAQKEVNEETDIEKIHKLRDSAILRIECQKKSDEMRKEVNALKAEIDGLRALDAASKTVLKGEADLLFASCNLAANAADKATLDNIAADFENKLASLKAKAEKNALAEGKRQFIEEIKKAAKDAKTTVNGYSFINYSVQNASSEFLLKLDAITRSFENNANDNSTGWNELDSLKTLAFEDISKTLTDAYSAECAGARASAKDSVKAAFTMPDHYSEANRATIEKIISDTSNALDGAGTVERILSLRDTAIYDIKKVYTLLDEAKESAKNKLNALYTSLKKDKDCYSESVWAEIQELYEHTSAEISQLSEFEDKDKADAIANERCALMKAKRKDKVITQAQSTLDKSSVYPSGFDISANGYAATLSAKGQIVSDAYFSVFPFSNENAVKLIRKAIKSGNVFLSSGAEAGKSLLKSLRGCNVLAGLNIDYSASKSAINGMYSISLLLPDTLDTGDILGVVYIGSDGGIEYFECNIDQKTLSFEIPHFSSFYIISEKTVNLMPLIVTLSIILLVEIAVISLLIMRRRKGEKETSLASFLPFLPVAALAKITPAGAIPTAVILGLLALCAGGIIAWLISREINQSLKNKKAKLSDKALPSPASVHAISMPKNAPSNLSRLSAPKKTEKDSGITDNVEDLDMSKIFPEPEKILVLEAVTVEEADDLMSDAEAKASLKDAKEEDLAGATYSHKGKKYEVNIDVISATFNSGETVSLEALKEKGLVSKNAKAVKILARGTLDKPLTVIAQDFSTAAIKMITLTGGHAMIVERD